PTNLDEATTVIAEIAETQRALDGINGLLNKRVARLQGAAMTNSQPLQKELDGLVDGLLYYANSHRTELLEGDAKSRKLPTGIIGWRLGSPAVNFTKPEPEIIEMCRTLGLGEFIRTPDPELDKQAILKEREGKARGIAGIEFDQTESFFVQPFDIKTQITRKVEPEPAAAAAPAA
ncbi:MAG: host-nuclease inhibitor Gam family protein, partial [bacterium]|nr:host-nuclease inhibitor Gam family protein [bacterium]